MCDQADAEDQEISAACAALVEAGPSCRELAAVAALDRRDQARLYREIRRLARGYVRQGIAYDDMPPRIAGRIAHDVGFASILSMILMAGLSAFVQFLVRKFWERWFPA
jgi:hypothetical protein